MTKAAVPLFRSESDGHRLADRSYRLRLRKCLEPASSAEFLATAAPDLLVQLGQLFASPSPPLYDVFLIDRAERHYVGAIAPYGAKPRSAAHSEGLDYALKVGAAQAGIDICGLAEADEIELLFESQRPLKPSAFLEIGSVTLMVAVDAH